MPNARNAAVPFHKISNGARVITDFDVAEQPWLNDFIRRFENCFTRSERGQYWILHEDKWLHPLQPLESADPAASAAR